MPLPSYAHYTPENEQLSREDGVRMQGRIDEWINTLKSQVQILDGNLISTDDDGDDLVLTTTATDIKHQLGRKWRGFFITEKDANVDVWSERVSDDDDKIFIRLDASGTVTVKVWVF